MTRIVYKVLCRRKNRLYSYNSGSYPIGVFKKYKELGIVLWYKKRGKTYPKKNFILAFDTQKDAERFSFFGQEICEIWECVAEVKKFSSKLPLKFKRTTINLPFYFTSTPQSFLFNNIFMIDWSKGTVFCKWVELKKKIK
jgi:hypothetical protein